LSIRRLIGVLKSKWWVMAFAFLIGGVLAGLIISYTPPTYKAEVTLYSMDLERIREEGQTLEFYDIQLSREVLNQFREVIHSRRVISAVIDELGQYNLTEKEILEKTAISSSIDSNIFYINAKDKDPEKAAIVANSMARTFSTVIRSIINTENVGILDEAIVPIEPERNYGVAFMILGMIAGSVLSFSALYVMEYFNPKVYFEEDLVEGLGFRVMGTIPRHNTDEGDFGYGGK